MRVFYSYAHEDEWCRDELAKMLAPVRQQGLLDDWHDRQIAPGRGWHDEIMSAIRSADIVLLLVSRHYLASEYCQVELAEALERRTNGGTHVVPVIVSSCLWLQDPRLSELQAVPADQPVNSWDRIEDALLAVASRLMELIEPGGRGGTSSGSSLAGMAAHLSTHWNVPHPASPNFANRSDLLDQVHDAVCQDHTVALHGGPGLGKSMLAVEYANRFRHEYRLAWWVRAEERVAGENDVLGLARALGFGADGPMGVERAREGLEAWCSTQSDYLLILDNAPSQESVDALVPWDIAGHLIATTRAPRWSGRFRSIAVTPWSLDESIEFLVRRTGQDDREAARKIAELLGGVPLALEQVASVILSQGGAGATP